MHRGVIAGQAFLDTTAGNGTILFRVPSQETSSKSATEGKVSKSNPSAHRFRLLTPAEIVKLPPLQWCVRGVLPSEGIGAVFGASGSGKSFLVLDMLAAVARGNEWFGCRVTQCPVLYCGLEGEAGISQRVQAHQQQSGSLADGFHFLLQPIDIRKATDRADLVQAAQAVGFSGGILAIDTLNRATPGADENDSAAMGLIIGALKELQAELGGLVLVVHHTGKNPAMGLRGHSSLHAALDCAVVVSRDIDRREWSVNKSKDGSDENEHPFRLEIVEVGTDEEGEPISSCVVVPEESTVDAFRHTLPSKCGNQKIVWNALGDVLKESKHFGKAGAAPTTACVELGEAIDRTKGCLVCDPKRRTERTQSAIKALINRGLLVTHEGWLWIK